MKFLRLSRAFFDYMFELDNLKNKDYFLDFINISRNYLGMNKKSNLK